MWLNSSAIILMLVQTRVWVGDDELQSKFHFLAEYD